jgi:DNA ligase-1
MNNDVLERYEEQCLVDGYEGIIIRDPNGFYKFGRSTTREGALLKVKRWTDSEATILDFNEFMHNANELEQDNFGYAKRSSHQAGKVPMDTLGSLACRDLHDGRLVDIGTGFSQAERKAIWEDKDRYRKAIVKYKHFAEAGVKDAPRHPVFLGFRHPEDM